jgi:Tfp pilus assembly protein PilO
MFNIILPIIISGISVALFFLQTSPLLQDIKVIEIERAALMQAQDSIDQFKEELKQKNAIFNTIEEDKKARLKKFLPDNIDNVRLIIDINQIASDNGMTIRNISIKGSDTSAIGPDSRPYGVATLGFSVSGPYQTFKRFLAALETSLRLVDVTSLSFSAGDKDQYEYNIEIKSYWLKQ